MIKNLELNKKLWLLTVFFVALVSFLRPLYNISFSAEEAFFYLILSLSFLALALLNFQQLKIKNKLIKIKEK